MNAFIYLFVLTTSVATYAGPVHHGCMPAGFQAEHKSTVTEEGCFHSKATGTAVKYAATFPAGHVPGKKYPYAIFLHGRGGDVRQFAASGGEAALDKVAKLPGGQDFIVVAPQEPRHSYWKNGPKGQFNTMKMVAEDLIAHVEKQILPGAVFSKADRAIFGISMGGHGTLYVADNYPKLFGRVYSISPIFRGESELDKSDMPAFGSGSDFRRQDPVSRYHARKKKGRPGFRFTETYRIEIGKDDALLVSYPGTKKFLEELERADAAVGKHRVDLSRPGGHDGTYWKGALLRALEFFHDYWRVPI